MAAICNAQLNNSLVSGYSFTGTNFISYKESHSGATINGVYFCTIANSTVHYTGGWSILLPRDSSTTNKKAMHTMFNGQNFQLQFQNIIARDMCCNVGFSGKALGYPGYPYSSKSSITSHEGIMLGGSDFTMECVMNTTLDSTKISGWYGFECWLQGQSMKSGAGELIGMETVPTNVNQVRCYLAGGQGAGVTITSSNVATTQQHYAFVYSHSAGKIYFFIAGQLVQTKSKTLTAQMRSLNIMAQCGTVNYYRISNVARYTANFTPPTSVSKDSNTLVFLHYPLVVDRSTTTTGFPYLVQSYNSTTSTTAIADWSNVNTDQPLIKDIKRSSETPFKTEDTTNNSVYTEGYQNFLIYNIPLGYTDFTIEFWMKPSSTIQRTGTNYGRIITLHDICASTRFATLLSINSSWKLYSAASSNNWSSSNLTTITGTTTISADTWYHVAYVYQKSSGLHTIYLNGVKQGTRTYTINPNRYLLAVLGDNGGRFVGKFSDLIISSTARWTAEFTKPTSSPSTSSTVGNLGRWLYL